MTSIRFAAAFAVAAAALAARDASAQTATQTVSYEVSAVNEISVSGSPSLVISAATAGSGLTSASASGTYAITTNETDRKITAEIDSDMPSGVTLSVSLAAPSGATSAGAVTLSSTAVDVVTGVSTVNQSGLNITYGLSATVSAGVVSAGNRTVTYTITAGA
ncbi:hypothetical protein [Longimicrobium terrae]|uniref:Opacity protein-like surface antigen n=1 Tax=Longimicrobium terrae TaxID=1639882 RepID=A0A841GW81_9BACT|nr:hypothetical protein [Longimicrobium terrae]MBB4635439.1 opacity protein-like surface antigen [Longimicrobium terrae]MBB6069833.1 opacity protein-like surface antigen [Longimicrobium terrae]NNC30962.1 hypothetical protein [Longimicrobium terrae]NNC32752.1 hypothetical protein [Longimicrobium terrae]